MLYKSLNENIQNIIDKKIRETCKLYFMCVLNELKYKNLYKNIYLNKSRLLSIYLIKFNNIKLVFYTEKLEEDTIEYQIYFIYKHISKNYITKNYNDFMKKKLLIIKNIYNMKILFLTSL
mgnify:CR=1 FL=1|jgi:hypothetical protein